MCFVWLVAIRKLYGPCIGLEHKSEEHIHHQSSTISCCSIMHSSRVSNYLHILEKCIFLSVTQYQRVTYQYLDPKFHLPILFEKLSKCRIYCFNFGIFHQLLSYFNWLVWYHCLASSFRFSKICQIINLNVVVNVARFARFIEWDFFYNFQSLCSSSHIIFVGSFRPKLAMMDSKKFFKPKMRFWPLFHLKILFSPTRIWWSCT